MTLKTRLDEAVGTIEGDAQLLHEIVHGDDQTTVTTEGGQVKSVANVIHGVQTQLDASRQDLTNQVATATQQASNAAQSASSAATSASTASTKATAASDSATSAASSATAAASSATTASTKASDASSSKTAFVRSGNTQTSFRHICF